MPDETKILKPNGITFSLLAKGSINTKCSVLLMIISVSLL